jgi:hypothetical protein
MKRRFKTKIALALGVSVLAVALLAGLALAATSGTRDQVKDRTKQKLQDGSCQTVAAQGTGNGVCSGTQAKTQTRDQSKTQNKTQLCDGSCTNASGTQTPAQVRTRDQSKTQNKTQLCDGSCNAK